ncbi:hypothetical protein MHU86_2783 [Fragilaria crotonensis]|nr:hypothetical protein MHU86_2783 [Fragilaria crotonensis]
MNAALQRCGFNAPTVTWLIAQGFATPNDLMLATESDLDSIARSVARSAPRGAGNVTMPFIAVKNLKGFRFWADERKRTGFEANPESFTADKVPEFTAKCQEYQEQKEAAKTKMHPSLTGRREAPENVLDPADFGSPMEYLIEATVLEGRHYELDNPRFYRELKTFVVNGEGWSYIKKFERSQDGRKAYLALKTQCEGTASKITRRPESKKVADFLKGITDPKLESAVSVVLGDPKLLNNFQACQQYLSTTVENRATLERSKERNISGVKSGEKTDKTAKAGKLPKGFKLENKYYPPKIFRLLSQEQKDQLKEWGDKKGKRSVAALKKQIKEELKNEMKKLAKETTMMAMMTMSQAQMKRPGRNSVAALTRRSRSWIRPDNAEPLRWFRGRYTQWITMQYTESVIVRVGARWTLTPTHAWQEIPIATVATAYDCPTSGATYVIIINEALYFGDSLPFSLLSPNQLRDNDVHVDERHRQHAPDSIFGILVPSEPLRIPFTLEGVVAGFDSRPQPKTSLIILPCMSNSPPTLSGFPHLRALARGGGCVGLRRRRGDYELASKALEGPTLQGNETEDQELHAGSCSEPVPFEMQIANEVNLLNQTDPILRRVAALDDDSGCELGGDWHCGDTNWRCDFRCNPRKCGTTLDGWIRDGKE